MKDKEWLREKVSEIVEFDLDHRFGAMSDKYVPLYELCNLIDQLDEPEITEEPTFLEHLTRLFKKHGYDHLGQVALALENDLEISINKELPVIPQFVAEYLEKLKGWDDDAYCYEEDNSMSLLSALDLDTFGLDEKVKNYLIENSETFARAWLYDYMIEPPKKLQVIVKNYDSTVYKTELPEDEAMKLIEGWKENE